MAWRPRLNMTFNLTKFLADHFRGGEPGDVVALVRAARLPVKPPSEEAVRKWRKRESITGENLAVLIAAAEIDRGAPVSVASYLGGKDGE